MAKITDKKKNFWDEPLFHLLVGIGILAYSENILGSLGFTVNDQGIASIIGSIIILGVIGLTFYLAIKSYKIVLALLAIIVVLALIFGMVSWFFALPATTIIIILLILILLK